MFHRRGGFVEEFGTFPRFVAELVALRAFLACRPFPRTLTVPVACFAWAIVFSVLTRVAAVCAYFV